MHVYQLEAVYLARMNRNELCDKIRRIEADILEFQLARIVCLVATCLGHASWQLVPSIFTKWKSWQDMLLDEEVFAAFIVDPFNLARIEALIARQYDMLEVDINVRVMFKDLMRALVINRVVFQVYHSESCDEPQLLENIVQLDPNDPILPTLQVLESNQILRLKFEEEA